VTVLPVEIDEFVLARIAEEEASWRVFGLRDEGFAEAVEKGLRRCKDKRRVAKAYAKKRNRPLRAELETYALAYYDHPEYDPDWRPSFLVR
jgi:hypothetical protein